MDVRVVLEGAPPGLQDAEEAGLITEVEARRSGEGANRGGGSREERVIADPLVRAQERPQRFGHGEGAHEVVGGQGAAENAPCTELLAMGVDDPAAERLSRP